MAYFEINGGKKLSGILSVSGSKNAALPCLAASLLFKKVKLFNAPKIADIDSMLEIMKSVGAESRWLENVLEIEAKKINLKNINQNLIKKIRASIILTAPFVYHAKKFIIDQPGGCHIGVRPIDTTYLVHNAFGIDVREENGKLAFERGKILGKGEVTLNCFSVTATEIALILAALRKKTTVIKIAAVEPHVISLIDFLKKGGADIELVESHTFKVKGPINPNRSIEYVLPPDYVEAGTFLVLGVLLGRKNLKIKNVPVSHLDIVFEKFSEMGARFKLISKNNEASERNFVVSDVTVDEFSALKAAKIQTEPYPGFPTDIQNVFGVLATQAQGTSLIFDTIYESRLKYLDELAKMGASDTILDPHRALITGPTQLYGKEITSFDIRCGASLVVAGLIAKGQTIIHEIESIDRGYERFEEKLQAVGADIVRKQ